MTAILHVDNARPGNRELRTWSGLANAPLTSAGFVPAALTSESTVKIPAMQIPILCHAFANILDEAAAAARHVLLVDTATRYRKRTKRITADRGRTYGARSGARAGGQRPGQLVDFPVSGHPENRACNQPESAPYHRTRLPVT